MIFFSYDRHKNLRTSLFWVFRKKETFAWVIFGKICYVALGKWLPACLPAWARWSRSHWQACYMSISVWHCSFQTLSSNVFVKGDTQGASDTIFPSTILFTTASMQFCQLSLNFIAIVQWPNPGLPEWYLTPFNL